ncbi:hypothetical protein AB0885_37970, partial [Streptomyces sp. NPDC005534]
MKISVVVAAREDDSPVEEPLRVATVADRLGYDEVWAGEGPTWDSLMERGFLALRHEHFAH